MSSRRDQTSELAALTSRETDCYSWHDSMVRHTLVDAAHSRAKPSALGSLSPETNLPVKLRLIVLCGVESVPGADGLRYGQRSYRAIGPHEVRPLLFQNYVNTLRQFSGHGDDSFARRYFLRMALIDAAIEITQLGIFLDGGPGALNQLVAQAAVAGTSNLAAIFFFAGRMLARHDPKEAGYLLAILYLLWIADPGRQVRSYNPTDPGQTQQQIDRLLQFWIMQAILTNLFGRSPGRLKMKVQRVEQIIELEAHRLRTGQRLQFPHRPHRPLLLRVRKRNAFEEQQRLNAQFAGSQLPYVRVAQLHKVTQVAIDWGRHVNAVQLSAAQTLRQLTAVESIGLHAFARRSRHFRWCGHHASISLPHQLVVQTKASRASFISKRHALPGVVLPHIVEQWLRMIGHAQRTHRALMIGENYRHALFINIEPRKHIVIAGYKPRYLNLNRHRRCSWLRLLNQPHPKQPT